MKPSVVRDLIDASLQAASVEDLHRVCATLCDAFEFEHFIYGSRFATSLVQPAVFIISGYPEEWRQRYVDRGYLTIDPTVAHSTANVRPLYWNELTEIEQMDPRVVNFLSEARQFGLVSGVTIPVHGARGEIGLLSVCRGEENRRVRPHIDQVLPALHLLSSYIHEAGCRLVAAGKLPFKRPELTPRERECLLWASEGKTSWETAQILGVSERTVIYHLQNASEKLGVSNRQQAVARAISQGLLTPQFG